MLDIDRLTWRKFYVLMVGLMHNEATLTARWFNRPPKE